LRSRFAHIFVLFFLLAGPVSLFVPASQAQTPGGESTKKQIDQAGENAGADRVEAFRHARPVKMVARMTHMDEEATAKLFEDLNSAILIGAILWFVFRLVPKALRKRSETLQKQLLDAHLQTTQANERLTAVEERLSKLGIEIDAIRQQTERESVEDEKRIYESLEAERERIVASAEQEIEAAGASARRDLKKFAAELAVDRALGRIHLSADDDNALIHAFAEGLKRERN
jgi:F-type H+-transporting ATPase subunit b